MRSLNFLVSLNFLLFSIFFSSFVESQRPNISLKSSAYNWTRAGFPTIVLIFTAFGLLIAIFQAGGFVKFANLRLNATFSLVWLIQLLMGVFMVFGENDQSIGGGVTSRMCIIAIQLLVHCFIGLYSVLNDHQNGSVLKLLVLSGAFNFLSLIGSNSLFGYSSPAFETFGYQTNTVGCALYFGYTSNDNRCDDEGFIGLLRVASLSAVFTTVFLSFLATIKMGQITGPDYDGVMQKNPAVNSHHHTNHSMN